MAAPDRLHFVRRLSWFWHGGPVVVVVAIGAWAAITQQSPYRWLGVVLIVVVAAVALRLALAEPSYVEGTVLVQRGLLRTHHADLARATGVRLRPNRWGSAQLVVTDDAGRSAFESLLTLDPYVKVAQPPELLERIGEALGTAPAESAAEVRKALAGQAKHLRDGGTIEDSPLRPLTRGPVAILTDNHE